MQSGPPCQEAWRFAAVFTGAVTEITEPSLPGFVSPNGAPTSNRVRSGEEVPPAARSFPRRIVRFKIDKALAGVDGGLKEIEIATGLGGGDCGYRFRRGEDYLVYAYKTPEGRLNTGICSRTRPLAEATEDLAYFRGLASAPESSEIRIAAYDLYKPWQPGPDRAPLAGRGLRGTRITINGAGTSRAGSTDDEGRYIFTDLPSGEYKVEATLDGYTLAGRPEPVNVRPKGCGEVWVPMQVDRRITGRVLAKEGLPAEGVTVQLVPTRPQHENDLPFATDSAATDAEGRYELRRFSAGDYYLGINLDRTPPPQNPYTRWFYPGTEEPSAAAILHFFDKPEAQRYDLMLPARQNERILKGTVFWLDGRPAQGANLFLEDPRWPWQVSTVAAVTNGDGRFVVRGLDGTRYRLHAISPARFTNEATSAEPANIPPGAALLELRLVLTRKGFTPMEGVGKGLERWRKGLGL